MNKVLLGLLMLVGFYSNAQETEFTFTAEKGMTDFIVTPVEGKNATEIYKKAIEWIKVTFKNPDKVILSTIENEFIRFEGVSDIIRSKKKYQIEISIKDGEYKFDLINLQENYALNQREVPLWNTSCVNFNTNSTKKSIENMYKSNGRYTGCFGYIPKFLIFFNDLNKSLFDSVVSTVKKTDGW
jgi:hypothetical protein